MTDGSDRSGSSSSRSLASSAPCSAIASCGPAGISGANAGMTMSVEFSSSGPARITSRQARSTAGTSDVSKCTWPPTSPSPGIGWNTNRVDDAEVAAAAAERPEHVGVLVGGDREHLARRGDELDLAQRVDGEALLTHEPADAAAEGEAADAHVAGVARADRQAERCEDRGDVRPSGTAPDAHEPVGANLDRGELGEVDDEAVVDRQEAVSAAADGDGQAGCRGEADGRRDLLDGARSHHDLGFADAGEDRGAGVVFGGAGSVRPAGNAFVQLREDRHPASLPAARRHAERCSLPANTEILPGRRAGGIRRSGDHSPLGCAFARSITHAYAKARSRHAE